MQGEVVKCLVDVWQELARQSKQCYRMVSENQPHCNPIALDVEDMAERTEGIASRLLAREAQVYTIVGWSVRHSRAILLNRRLHTDNLHLP